MPSARYAALPVLVCLCTAVACGAAGAESLWSDTRGPLFRDFRAAKVGDIVTVMVLESAISTQKASTDLNRSSEFDVGPGVGKLFNNIPGVGYSGNSTSNGNGTTARSSNLITTMTATVTQVMENGNLLIQGEREIKTNDENQTLRLTGVVRPVDISRDNSISSTNIADARIELTGKGPIGQRQKEGIFTRLIRLLF